MESDGVTFTVLSEKQRFSLKKLKKNNFTKQNVGSESISQNNALNES